MFRRAYVIALAACTALCAPIIVYPTSMAYPAGPTGDVTVRRRQPAKPAATLAGQRYRGKGQQARPKRRRNMVTVSRRVRRKHRRAA
jgi:hypothetical protein